MCTASAVEFFSIRLIPFECSCGDTGGVFYKVIAMHVINEAVAIIVFTITGNFVRVSVDRFLQ